MLEINKHKNVMLQILKDIYTDTSLGPLLGFMGGTALYLFYDLPRFSTDLDFDLLSPEKEEFVFNKMEEIIRSYGTLKEKSNKKNTLFYFLSYSAGLQNVKVEVSKRNFGSSYELKNYLGIPMLVMKKEDLFANKLAALIERKEIANRDLLDLWFFLKNDWEVNETIVKKRSGLSLKEYLKKCLDLVEKINQETILTGMGELLDNKLKAWTKASLKTDLLFLLSLKIESLS